jgi:hypothetical protein
METRLPRFLHIADRQIGRQCSQFLAHAVLFSEARLTAPETIKRLAMEHKVDAVLVATHVFNAQMVSDCTVRRQFNAMAAYTGPWLMIPGSHDAALAESVWTCAGRLAITPENLYLAWHSTTLYFHGLGFAPRTISLLQV